jgi:hypothetical protein
MCSCCSQILKASQPNFNQQEFIQQQFTNAFGVERKNEIMNIVIIMSVYVMYHIMYYCNLNSII